MKTTTISMISAGLMAAIVPTAIAATNLLTNGSFETGVISPWTTTGTVAVGLASANAGVDTFTTAAGSPDPAGTFDVSFSTASTSSISQTLNLTKGTGKSHPYSQDRVRVHYSGWTPDGKLFDSSVARGEPTEFPLNGVIKGWTEGVRLMVVGDKTRFWIPGDLAYGNGPARGGAPTGMLVFDIELLEILPAE